MPEKNQKGPGPLTSRKVRPNLRPEGPGPLTSRYVIPASDAHRAWLAGFREKVGEIEVADVIRESLRRWAESIGHPAPPRR